MPGKQSWSHAKYNIPVECRELKIINCTVLYLFFFPWKIHRIFFYWEPENSIDFRRNSTRRGSQESVGVEGGRAALGRGRKDTHRVLNLIINDRRNVADFDLLRGECGKCE